jgi:branched-chain amino acid transport system ATP-binding protein
MDGRDIGGKSAHRLARGGLSLVPEGRALFAGLTTRENLRLSAGPGRSHDEVLDLLPELRKCLDRKAGLLSGGEQQMLAVGRAIARRPRVLLIDEMSLGLAPAPCATGLSRCGQGVRPPVRPERATSPR